MTFLDRYSEQAYAVLRIVAGLLFFAHGLQKFFDFPTAFPLPLSPMLTVAGIIELVAGILIVIGVFTRPAAFVPSGMAARSAERSVGEGWVSTCRSRWSPFH